MSSDTVALNAGSVFVLSSRAGDIHARTSHGFYAFDTRFISRLRLTIQGQPLSPVGVSFLDSSFASFYTSARNRRHDSGAGVSVVRDRLVTSGLHEDITLINHSRDPATLKLVVTIGADFADVFEVRRGRVRKTGSVTSEPRGDRLLVLKYQREEFTRASWVSFSADGQVSPTSATFMATLSPAESWTLCVEVQPTVDALDAPPPACECPRLSLVEHSGPHRGTPSMPVKMPAGYQIPEAIEELPKLETERTNVQEAYNQALADLTALRIEHDGHSALAAGLPWFMAIFGRDSIISAVQTKLLGPELMVGTLEILASLQATEIDTFREAEPGKIPHEVRRGELSITAEVPHTRYYGTVDATPLFVRLLWEAYQWTGDDELLRRFIPAAQAALDWIDRYGDVDGDGFVEFRRRTPRGLRNQCWKDSHDSISFNDGTLAKGAIAVSEVQGYVYDAKIKLADLLRTVGDRQRAGALEDEAQRLKDDFNRAFWMPEVGYYALALDGHKNQVDSVASNVGHCLWSGIVSEDKASAVVERLMAPDMFSGWGIRTLGTQAGRYNPLSYHNGSVWPHDTSIVAAGMARYGFTTEARELIFALFDAIAAFPGHRPPELFAGYPRGRHSMPVPYPDANVPQAWASGAVIYALEILLGLTPAGDRLLLEAQTDAAKLSLDGVRYRGHRLVT